MNLRHAAALALVGWYLMVPPLESCIGAFSGGACNPTPLAKWRIVEPYDSLSRCENAKAVWVEKGRMYLSEMGASNQSRTMRMSASEAGATVGTAATCVAIDDPRLKGK